MTKLTLKERVELVRQEHTTSTAHLLMLIEDLWREVERLRKHYQER